uniref:Uncharacterized protein n=1 Tax=Lactuca sativa TaxID=4236 RepID=A0A9R1WY81_LACSA|nr:hypothetical protein LSAT_V11C800389930 [Lactuca sativa]
MYITSMSVGRRSLRFGCRAHCLVLKITRYEYEDEILSKNLEGPLSRVNASVDEKENEDILEKIFNVKNDKVRKGNFESSRKTRSSSKKEKAKEVLQTRSKKSKKTVIEQPKVNLKVKGKKLVFEKVKIVSKKRELSNEDDFDFRVILDLQRNQKEKLKL